MPDTDLELQVRLGGLGDMDGDERTLSQEACDEIHELVRKDLAERYTDIDTTDEINVVCVNAPNVAIIRRETDE